MVEKDEAREFVGKRVVNGVRPIDLFADKHYSFIKKREKQLKTAANELRKIGFGVNAKGEIYERGKKKPDYQERKDRNNADFLFIKGRAGVRARTNGTNLSIYPSKYAEEFMVSAQSWGGFGMKLMGIKKEDVICTENSVKIKVDFIEIFPDPEQHVPEKVKAWVKKIKLPQGMEDAEAEGAPKYRRVQKHKKMKKVLKEQA